MRDAAKQWLARLARFSAVGIVNNAMKLLLLAALREWAGMGYLAATALAVEAAVLHGFFWHQVWTWSDRGGGGPAEVAGRAARYNLSTGALALAVNLGVMRGLVGGLKVHYLAAAAAATVCAGLLNFMISDRLIFLRARPASVTSQVR